LGEDKEGRESFAVGRFPIQKGGCDVATRWIDFSALKRQVSIKDVLARYGLLNGLQEKKPGRLVGPCPIHGGKNGTSFNVDLDKNVFHCFSQCGGGNVLDLVMKLERTDSIRTAGEKLADWFGLKFERSRPVVGSKSPQTEPAASAPTPSPPVSAVNGLPSNPPLERPLRDLNPNHPYLVARGLTIPTIREFGIGYCTRGLMRGRIAIPIHDEEGRLVAYAGRAVEQTLAEKAGKYRLPDGFKKSLVLFNLHRAIAQGGRVGIVVEGFVDVFILHQAGFSNVVALMGSTLSEAQENLLLAHFDRLALMFDGDEAGTKCLREFYARLRRRTYLREIHLEAGEQPDSLSDDRIRELFS
jgi:DNA primase